MPKDFYSVILRTAYTFHPKQKPNVNPPTPEYKSTTEDI